MTEGLAGLAGILPRPAGRVRLDHIGVDGLLALRRMEDEEGFEHLTCRPLHSRNGAELRFLYQTALEDPGMLICGIYVPGQAAPAGKLTASDHDPRNRSAELGYFLAPDWRGRGYMTDALSAFCRLLLRCGGLNKVYAQTAAFNISSARLLERAGFRRDGILRQHHELDGALWDDWVYSLLSGDLEAKG